MKPGKPFLATILIILSMTFAVRASNNMFSTTIPLLAKYNFHFDEVMVGLISAAGAAGTFLMSALVNARLRSGARRTVFIASSFVYMAVFPLFYLANSFFLWPLVIISGFVLGAIFPNIVTSASLFSDKKVRERTLSLYTLTLSISLVAGPAIESEVLKYFSLQQSFLFFSVFPVLAFLTSFFIRFPEEIGKTGAGGRDTLSNHGFRAALYTIMTYNIPFAMILTFGGIFAKEYFGASYSTITLLFSMFFLTSFLSRLMFTARTPENLWKLMVLSVAITGIGLLVLSLSTDLLIFAVSFLILGFPHGFTFPISIITITRNIEPEKRSIANSYFFSIIMLIGTVMPFASGLLVGAIGLRDAFISIIPLIFVLFLMLRLEMSRGHNERTEAAAI